MRTWDARCRSRTGSTGSCTWSGRRHAEATDLPDGPNGQHDFEIDTGERTIALEVTSTTVGEVRTMWDAVGKQSWECTKCSWGWSISVEAAGPGNKGAPIGQIRRRIEDHLLVLEQAEINYFGPPHPLPTDPAAANAVKRWPSFE